MDETVIFDNWQHGELLLNVGRIQFSTYNRTASNKPPANESFCIAYLNSAADEDSLTSYNVIWGAFIVWGKQMFSGVTVG